MSCENVFCGTVFAETCFAQLCLAETCFAEMCLRNRVLRKTIEDEQLSDNIITRRITKIITYERTNNGEYIYKIFSIFKKSIGMPLNKPSSITIDGELATISKVVGFISH
ncbi:hypothetical protein RF11_04102 [Thelohanellus kitauei]|uniref:Uncharacterized protein n=1 Tax=Thelohanellus kitauei TaxID=669202 RepID=A0A0C2MFA6_THEKT|nr:hypothetical protein RF11_04102 [Thelohanellus kitauei]